MPIQATNFLSLFRRRSSASIAQSGQGRALGVSGEAIHERTVRAEHGRWVCSAIRPALSTCVTPDSASNARNLSLLVIDILVLRFIVGTLAYHSTAENREDAPVNGNLRRSLERPIRLRSLALF